MAAVRVMRAAWFGLAILVLPSTVLAQPTDVEALADQLANAKDFRVRTQAALALGASKSKGAVEPLCSGLGDENSTVRAASAAALGKLRKGGRECLKRQLVAESKESVKSVIERSIARLDAGAAPLITERTMFFVALEVIDDTGRGGDAVSQQFRSAVARAVAAMPEFAIAPREQSRDEAKSLLALHPKVTGFLLSAKIKAQYAGGALTVKIETAIFTYPDRNLLGTFSRTLSMQGVTGVDRAAEDELIRTGAARSMETFAPMAQKLR